MIFTTQDILYVTVSVCILLFTIFLIWIMYYLVQITRQSNEMITDFRDKMEELDASVKVIKDKVNESVDQIGSVLDIVRALAGKSSKKKRRSDD
ncbi:MAG: hypothetical protein WCV88_00100 [Patescibacteria group bacterium]